MGGAAVRVCENQESLNASAVASTQQSRQLPIIDWQQVTARSSLGDALRQARLLLGEGDRLVRIGEVAEARQKWLAAAEAFNQAKEPLGAADAYQRLANSYLFKKPDTDMEQLLRELGLDDLEAGLDLTKVSKVFEHINIATLLDPEALSRTMDYYFSGMFAAVEVYEPLIRKEITYDQQVLEQAEELFREGYEKYQTELCGEALPLLGEALRLFGSIDYGAGQARSLAVKARCQMKSGDVFGGMASMQEALGVASSLPVGDSTSERYLAAKDLFMRGELEESEARYLELLDDYRQHEDLSGQVQATIDLGAIYASMERYAEGEIMLLEALELLARVDPEDEYRALNIGAARHNLAHLNVAAGRPTAAVRYHCDALLIWREIGEPAKEVASLSGLGLSLRASGHYREALLVLEEGWRLQELLSPEPEIEGDLLNNIGYTYFSMGDDEKALDFYEQAVDRRRQLSHPRKFLETLNNIAAVKVRQGRLVEARQDLQEILTQAQDGFPAAGVGKVYNNIAAIAIQQGDYQTAVNIYLEALPIVERNGDLQRAGWLHVNLSSAFLRLVNLKKALHHLEKGLEIFEKIGNPDLIAEASANLGALHLRTGRVDAAEEHLRRAEKILSERANLPASIRVAGNLARASALRGNLQEALQLGREALLLSEQAGNQVEQVRLSFVVAIFAMQQGESEAARGHLKRALELSVELGMAAEEIAGRTFLAMVHYLEDRRSEALTELATATERLESLHATITVPAFKTSLLGQFFFLYDLAVFLSAEAGKSEEAFRYAEKARARAFLDQLASQRVDFRHDASSELIGREQDLRWRLRQLQSDLATEREPPPNERNQGRIARLERDQDVARAQYTDLLAELKVASPEYGSLINADVLGISEVQEQILDDETTLVEYHVMGASAHEAIGGIAWAWVIDRQSYELVPLDISSTELQAKVLNLRNHITAEDFDEAAAGYLYDKLVAPLNPHIRHRKVILVPHGVLHYLPFGALWNAERGEFLVEERTLTLTPSVSVLPFLAGKQSPRDGRALVLGNPDGSLIEAESEAKSVARMLGTSAFLGDDATESTIFSQAGNFDLLHLAAHAVYEPDQPFFSRVELAPGEGEDGRLEVHEIFELDLEGTDLVVLSACKGGLGKQSRGDELIGLTRAFLYAGSPTVVTSLWAVEDEATETLMESFYHHMDGDLSTAQALRKAQLEVMAEPRWRSPFFWAAFTVTGDHAGNGGSESAPETLAVLTSFSGEVAVAKEDAELAATPLMFLSEGDRIQLSAGARASVVCRDDRLLDLEESQLVTSALCARGAELPPGSFSVVEPRGGRVQPVAGSDEPARTTREIFDHYGKYPVVLKPRHTALLEAQPSIQWTEVPGALDYEIQWSGPGFPAFSTSRKELSCRSEELFDGPVTTCTMDWPLDAPQLQEGGVYFLSVGAWFEAELQPRIAEESRPNRIRILEPKRAQDLRLVTDRMRSVPGVDEATRHYVLAGFHLEDEVLVEAISAYRRVVDLQPSAKVYSTLGDAYRQIELYRYAIESYEQALSLAVDDADRAAAEFGLGQVDYARRQFRDAWQRFGIASEIYTRLGIEEEAAKAVELRDFAHGRIRR